MGNLIGRTPEKLPWHPRNQTNEVTKIAPRTIAILAVFINPKLLPNAALVVELELAALVMVDPFTPWLTTETFTFEELVQELLERIVAVLLNVMSAH